MVGLFGKSSVVTKMVMALTGAFLLLFLTGHMVGNLQLFAGQDTLNSYAELLHANAILLWAMRSMVIAAFFLHIWSSISLTLNNMDARPVAYTYQKQQRATISSRYMFVTGVAVLAFLIYHLAHLTLRWTNPEYIGLTDPQGRFDVYTMVVMGFQNSLISTSYIVGMLALWTHLNHSASSVFQTIGLRNRKYDRYTDLVGPIFATVIVAGNITMPLAVLFGFVHL